MARIFITGSADGLGFLAAEQLLAEGHQVTLHARDQARAQTLRRKLKQAEGVLIGDVASLSETRALAEQANASGAFHAVIHNVGIGYQEPQRSETVDGIERVFAINVLAPYLLTALLTPPKRLVYLSSGMHHSGASELSDPQWSTRRWNGSSAYATSKLLDVLLAFGVARRWPGVLSNAVEPGWVPTKMGGPGAPDDLALGAVTQAWLAVSEQPPALVTGKYFFHQKQRDTHPSARDEKLQDQLLAYCEQLSGVALAAAS